MEMSVSVFKVDAGSSRSRGGREPGSEGKSMDVTLMLGRTLAQFGDLVIFRPLGQY